MIRQINYNFDDIEYACATIIDSDGRRGLDALKKELNRFFKDSNCKEIIFTRSDSMFFGMCVYPMVDKNLVTEILQDDKQVRFNQYTIEIDSKILHPALQITPREFTAMILHEVGHIVNDPEPVDEVRKVIALQLVKKGDSLNIPKTAQYYTIISYGIKDTVRKMTSMFFIYRNGEVLADEFVHMCGYGDDLNSIFDKICKSGMKINDTSANKLTSLAWSLSVYKELKVKRIPALRLLKKMHGITGSEIEKREMEIMMNAITTIDDTNITECCDYTNRELYYVFNETKTEMKQSKFAELRKQTTIKNIRKFEQDLYEYKMRIRHVADEDDAYYLMRMINTRISVIEDFLDHERLNEQEHKRWWKLLEQYYSLRDELANVTTYRYDYSDSMIVVKYPEIKPGRM
jgi:hypothetical protein